ncbi:MarR family winged helix-turn-helix transcriptional regulator [Raineyella sp.]|uniref:MarR family winged helix-turn-helix transcriptional regulator n=1 Tax=Raineyella sp. TaxID=1911550 RepID=UPI002B217E8B|nr:MarR family winged helix-turn-helix transcriptional regulator [Raineyella sp.]MEA5154777.1 MarR family winged helix-turn-helix transcriptional regulator [Raineyella sp.]
MTELKTREAWTAPHPTVTSVCPAVADQPRERRRPMGRVEPVVDEQKPLGVPGKRPLSAVLRHAEMLFVAEFEERIATSDFADLSLAHSANVLRFLQGGPQRASQFIGSCGVSKQAVSLQIAQLEKRGYITSAPDPQDQRARILALTERGEAAQAEVQRIYVAIEKTWTKYLGPEDATALRRILEKLP